MPKKVIFLLAATALFLFGCSTLETREELQAKRHQLNLAELSNCKEIGGKTATNDYGFLYCYKPEE